RDHRRDVLADHADRDRRLTVQPDQLLKGRVPLGLVRLDLGLLPGRPHLADRVVPGRLLLLVWRLVVPVAVEGSPGTVVDDGRPAARVGLDDRGAVPAPLADLDLAE